MKINVFRAVHMASVRQDGLAAVALVCVLAAMTTINVLVGTPTPVSPQDITSRKPFENLKRGPLKVTNQQ